MKPILVLIVCLLCQISFAKTFTLTDDTTKAVYVCSDSAAPTTPIVIDTQCVTKIKKLCPYDQGTCFSKAVEVCKGKDASFSTCVKTTQNECPFDQQTCFDEALKACL